MPTNARRWMPPMMSDNQNPRRIADDAKKKMIRKAMKVDAAKVVLADREGFGTLDRLQDEASQLAVEVVCKLRAGDPLVILHNRVDIGVNLRMQDKPHQRLRALICWSSCSRVMPISGFASNSASRRKASAMPSSASWRTDGSERSR